MTDWEAAIVAYIALAVVAETEWAPVAVVLAWGVAIEQVIEGASGKTFLTDLLGKLPWSGVSGGSKPSSG